MAGKTISIRIPDWTENLITNVLTVGGLATICVMIAFLTDWRWGGLAGGVCSVALGWLLAPKSPAGGTVKPAGASLKRVS